MLAGTWHRLICLRALLWLCAWIPGVGEAQTRSEEHPERGLGRELDLQLGWLGAERLDDGEHALGIAWLGRSALGSTGSWRHVLLEGGAGFVKPVDPTMSSEAIFDARLGLQLGPFAIALGAQARYASLPVAPLQWLPSALFEYQDGELMLGLGVFDGPLAPPARLFALYRGVYLAALPFGVAFGFERDLGKLGMFGLQFFTYRWFDVGFFGSIAQAGIHDRRLP